MGDNEDNPSPSIRGLTYFEDFIRLLEKEYAEASVIAVAEEIEYVRSFAPARTRLKRREDGVFILKAPIGRGHFAIVELEFDVDGVLQPVMGGILRK
jgi:hypothetical protein